MSERLLTAAELGELLGLTPGTVLDRFERGDLPGYRLFGRTDKNGRPIGPVRFRLSEVEALLANWHRNGRAPGGEVAAIPTEHPPEGPTLRPAAIPVGPTGGECDASEAARHGREAWQWLGGQVVRR